MEDTVAMARLERDKQGELEVEITYEGDTDLQKHFQECKKNPGHTKFIPINEFDVNHLPDGCRDEDLVELVRALADLTVRMSVKYVSEDRPETEPGRDKPYPCYKVRGTNMERVGTGLVCFVEKYPDEYGRYTPCLCNDCLLSPSPKVCKCEECLESDSPTTCQCHECLKSGKPETRFAHIVILTAVHIVYDDLEGAQTTCHLFFDNGDEPEKCASAVPLKGMLSVWSDDARDWCEMTFVTHDMKLADRLGEMKERWVNIRKKVVDKFRPHVDEDKQSVSLVKSVPEASSFSTELVPEALKKLTLLVSHPHGCSKQVSVGSCTDRDSKVFKKGQESDTARYLYTTPSCPGCSGGPVFILDRSWCGFHDTHIHSGGRKVESSDEQSNFTCYGSEVNKSEFTLKKELTDKNPDFWTQLFEKHGFSND